MLGIGRDPLGLDDEDCPFGFEDTGFRVVIGGVEYTVCHNPRTGKSALGGTFDLDPVTIEAEHPGKGDSEYEESMLDRILFGDKCVDGGRVVTGIFSDGICRELHTVTFPAVGPAGGPRVVGKAITGFSKHGINQVVNRGVSPPALLEAARNGVTTGVRVNHLGRESIRIVGPRASFTINLLGRVITAWRW